MKQRNYRGEWAGSSHLTERMEELRKAHEEFEASELKKRLDDNWKITGARVRRPRIKYEPFKVIMVFGKPVKITIEEYNKHYSLTIK